MMTLSRWLIPSVLAVGLGVASLLPAPARASDDLVRVMVDIADVIYRSGQPYYRYGNNGRYDRVVVLRDGRGHRRYYREVPRRYYRAGPPYGVAHGYRNAPVRYDRKCNRNGKCKVQYYDPRRDDRRYRDDRGRYDRYDVSYREDKRRRDRYDD